MPTTPQDPRRPAARPTADDPLAHLPQRDPVAPRLYIREPGWAATIKIGSEPHSATSIEPGEEHYHRLSGGELHLHRADVRLCLRCADRLGLVHFEPKRLKEPSLGVDLNVADTPGYDIRGPGNLT